MAVKIAVCWSLSTGTPVSESQVFDVDDSACFVFILYVETKLTAVC